MGHSSIDPAFNELRPWNEGRVLGAKRALKPQRRGGLGNPDSGDKWIADLTAAMLAASGRQDEQATAPES